MPEIPWLQQTSPAFRLMIATSWLAPDSWRDNQEEAIREAIAASPDWAEYLRLVDWHRTPALSCAALKRLASVPVPTSVQQVLQKGGDACRIQAMRHCMRLAEILKALNRAEIPVMPLKGPLLSLDLYGDVGLRQSRDLDLMVRSVDISQARTCMESIGWRLEDSCTSLTPRQWGILLIQEHHLGFVHSQAKDLLELHWRNFCDAPGQAAARWEKSTTVVWQGSSYQVMHPIDRLLYLCIHGGRHTWFRAKWLGDLARLHALGQMDWTEVFHQAREAGQEQVLLWGLRLLQEGYALPLPEPPECPRKALPSYLLKGSLHALKEHKETGIHGIVSFFRERIYLARYNWLVLPQQRWRDLGVKFFCTRLDFQIIRLPDRFFWGYVPLRPFLLIWRQVLRRGPTED
jgi:hypothetical protein